MLNLVEVQKKLTEKVGLVACRPLAWGNEKYLISKLGANLKQIYLPFVTKLWPNIVMAIACLFDFFRRDFFYLLFSINIIPCVNFINILLEHFSYKSALTSFFLITVWLCNFFGKILLLQKLLLKCWWNWLPVSLTTAFKHLRSNVLCLQTCLYRSLWVVYHVHRPIFTGCPCGLNS